MTNAWVGGRHHNLPSGLIYKGRVAQQSKRPDREYKCGSKNVGPERARQQCLGLLARASNSGARVS